ncbi:response regulator [Christensenellaceae bacterium OttesenSCG-928-K19]|nr:response regulator [Christensenellaceae bacterium OttesenSCG-928-K19]
MIRIVVADDELQIREGIKFVLDELADEVLTASDGEKAFELISAQDTDILITDISMPVLDGIEMLKALRQTGNDCKVIVISGYKNFDYAQQAVKLGAVNYILKPIDENELMAAVQTCIDMIHQERRRRAEQQAIEKQVYEQAADFMQYVLYQYLNGDGPHMESGQGKTHAFLNELTAYSTYLAAIVRGEGIAEDAERLFRAREALTNLSDGRAIVLPDHNDMLFVYAWNGSDDLAESTAFAVRMQDMATAWQKETGSSIHMGVGTLKKEFARIGESYCEASIGVFFSEHTLLGKLNIAGIVNECAKREYPPVDQLEEDVTEGLQKGNVKEAETAAIRLIEYYIGQGQTKNLVSIQTQYSIIAHKTTQQYGAGMAESVEYGRNWLKQIQETNNLDTLFHVFIEGLIYFHELRGERNPNERKIIEEVRQYIKDHLSEELSLRNVADEFYFSPNYFSRLFSENVGIPFRQHLINERVKRAKALLRDPKIKIYQIANMVGYRESRNFMKVFKSNTGMTMTEFRETV